MHCQLGNDFWVVAELSPARRANAQPFPEPAYGPVYPGGLGVSTHKSTPRSEPGTQL